MMEDTLNNWKFCSLGKRLEQLWRVIAERETMNWTQNTRTIWKIKTRKFSVNIRPKWFSHGQWLLVKAISYFEAKRLAWHPPPHTHTTQGPNEHIQNVTLRVGRGLCERNFGASRERCSCVLDKSRAWLRDNAEDWEYMGCSLWQPLTCRFVAQMS